jgi:peptide/nickel transport system permease protein
MIPVITIVGMQLPILIGGSAVLESIFALPGIGGLLIKVINNRDYLVLSGINMIMATVVLVINLMVDIMYAYLDPRVHYS